MTDTGRHAIPFGAYEWDARKRQQNLERHGIDFEDVTRIFEAPILRLHSQEQCVPDNLGAPGEAK